MPGLLLTWSPAPRRYASTSNLRQGVAVTPATSLSQLSLATPPPSPPAALLPLHVRAKALLRPTCNDGPSMAGREQERATIEMFILGFLSGGESLEVSSALYISGSPGTGKTALVNSVLGALADQLKDQDTQILSVNCMALDGVDAVWQRLAEMFRDGKQTSGRGRKLKDSPHQIVEKALAATDRKWYVLVFTNVTVFGLSGAYAVLLFWMRWTTSHHPPKLCHPCSRLRIRSLQACDLSALPIPIRLLHHR